MQKAPTTAGNPMKVMRITPGGHNTAMPPKWRWDRATWLRSNGISNYRLRKEDPWVAIAFKFQTALAKCESDINYQHLRDKYPGLYEAWTLFTDADRQNAKWAIEAYLCAGAKLAHIADRACHAIDTVFCYTKVFFDIMGKQRHRMYMVNEVFGPSVHSGLSERQYDVLWKMFGLIKGPLFLDRFIGFEGAPARMTSAEQGAAHSADLQRIALENKALIAARTIPAYNQEIILTAYQKMIEIEQESGRDESAKTLIIANINKTIGSFGFTVAEDRPDADAQFLDNGVELRASDMVSKALGQSVEPKPEMKLEKFPDPIPQKQGQTNVNQ